MKLFNLFSRKTLVLNFYTDRKEVFDLAKPIKASKAFPDWWKDLPKEMPGDPITPMSTMKRCIGFTELYNNGFILPMWSDLNIDVGPIGTTGARWCYADMKSGAGNHPAEQRGNYLPDTQYQHLKLTSPWHAVCDEDVKWAYFQPTWNFNNPETLVIPPAVIDFKYQTNLNVNLFLVRTDQAKMHNFLFGQPMAHIVPLTERPVEYRFNLVTKEELDGLRTPSLWFTNKYTNFKTAAGKCPFGTSK